MNDIKNLKNISDDNKRPSRADEIEEIYRGTSQLNNRTIDSGNSWTRASSERPKGWKWFGLVVGGLAIVGLFMFLFSVLFGKATIIITPKQGDLILSGVVDAVREGATSSSTIPSLTYGTIAKVTDTEKRLVNATGMEKVEKKAEGQIVIYNQNLTSQKLVVNTRFQATNGKVYRLKEAATIPAGKKDKGSIIPGSVEANVIADKAGPDSNQDVTDFTIPGFAKTAKFKTVFARSKTAMSGGFIGDMRKVSQADLDKNRIELQKILRDRLLMKAGQDVPSDFVLFSDAIKIKYEDQIIDDTSIPADKAYVAVKAELSGIIFKRSELAAYFAQKLIPNYDNTPVEITNLESLEFALQNKDILDLEKTTKISFSLDGTGHVVWTFDQDKLKGDLVGQSRSVAEKAYSQFIAIERVKTVFFPPWLWTFPKNKDKIVIDIEKGVKKP